MDNLFGLKTSSAPKAAAAAAPASLPPAVAALMNSATSAPQTGNLPVGVAPGSGGASDGDKVKIDAPASNTGIYVFAAVTGVLIIAAVIKVAVSK